MSGFVPVAYLCVLRPFVIVVVVVFGQYYTPTTDFHTTSMFAVLHEVTYTISHLIHVQIRYKIIQDGSFTQRGSPAPGIV